MSNASLTTIAYNASTGVLTMTGTNLPTNAVTIGLGALTLKAGGGGAQLTLNSSRDTLSNLTASGFNVTLSAADQAVVNGFFNVNGTSTGNLAYGLTASNGWDGNANDAISNLAVTVTGAGPQLAGLIAQTKLLDSSSANPFSQISISDSNISAPETASISFTAANGILSGSGLSAATVNNGVTTYTVSASSASALQQVLQGLVFTPTAHQSAAGQTVTTAMTLTVSDQITNNLPLLTLSNGILNPCNLTSDSQGNIWVANYYNNTVEKFSASGVLLNTLSNGLNAPDSLAIDSQGNVWVANHNNNTVEKFSSSGALLNTLSNGINIPQSLAIDSQGNVWIANNNNNTVEKFSSNGALLNTLSNGILGPQNLTLDSQGNVWVTNNNNNTVEKFSSSGVLLNTLSNGINAPDSLAIDSQGNVWVANYNNSTIEKFSSSGVLLNTLSNGINTPDSLAIDSQGNVWVANYYFNTVEKFSASGVLLNTLSNGISGPDSLSIDSQGNVWVANYYNNTVEKFSSSGVLVSNTITDKTTQLTVTETQVTYNASTGQLTLTGVNPTNTPILGDLTLQVGGAQFTLSSSQETISQLSNGFNITLSAADKAIVNTYANTNGSSTGNAAYALLASNAWDGNASDRAANFALTVTGAGPVLAGLSAQTKILDTSTRHPFGTTTVTDSNASVPITATISFTAVNGALSGVGLSTATISNGLATYTLSANNVFALQQSLQGLLFTPTAHQTAAGQIVTTSMTLTVSDQIINNFPTQILSNGVNYPNSLAIDKQGNVWVANYSTVEQFSASGVLLNTINNGISITAGLVIDSQGNIWVANQGNSNIEEFSASGLLLNTLTNGVSGPNHLAIDSQGNVWSANYNNNTVEKFSASGVLLNTLNNGISFPRSLAIDSQGNVWVGNSNTVEQFSTSGVLLNTLSNGISFPMSLAIDNQGNVWVANMYNNTVEKFSSNGVLLNTLSNGISNPNSLAIDKQGNVWVGNNNSVEQFSASGVLLNTLSNGISSLTSLTIDGQGNLWITNSNNTVEKFSITPVTNSITDKTTQITVTETTSPVLSQVSYNAGTGQLTITGSNLSTALVLGDLTLNAGSQSFSLNASTDTLNNVSATSFTVNLSPADQNKVNTFFNANGGSSSGSIYSLTASSGWDNSLNGNSAKVAVTVSGVGISLSGLTTTGALQDIGTLNPLGKVSLTDSHNFAGEIATISFTAANGMLSGNGLSAASISNGMATYSLSTNSASAMQQALQGLVFTPTAHQGTVGQTVTTKLALTISAQVAYPALTLTNGVSNPHSLAIDSQGHVWLANGAINSASNTVSGSIQELSSTGKGLLSISPNNYYDPVSLTIDSQGNVWSADSYGLNEFSSSGALLLHDGNGYGYSSGQSIAIDKLGNVWLASLMDSNSYAKVVKLSASGVALNTLYISVASGYNSYQSSGLNSINSVVTDSQNNVWVANSSNHFIQEFSTSGVLINTLSMGIVDPVSLATDSQGNIWVANGTPVLAGVGIATNNASIEEFSASGTLLHTLTGVIKNPDFLLTDRFGDLWVADAGNNTVEEFSASGVLLKTLSSGVANPKSLAIDSQGNVWVVNGNNTVEKFLANTPSNSVTSQATSLTVTETAAPALSAVAYNATSGILTLTGNNLSSALTISDLKLSAGNQYFTLNPTDNVINASATSVQVSLSSTDQTAVNSIFYSNGTGNSKTPFTLTASAGWDHSLSNSNSTQQTVTVSGAGPVLASISASTALLDTGTAQPFSKLTLTDANASASEIATISFTATNGTLSGNGLSTPLMNAGVASYTIAASSAANLQQTLQGLVFTPTAHQLAKGQTVTSLLTLKITDQSLYSLPIQNFTQGITNPQSLSVDTQGNVWVANGNNTLEKFSASGSLLTTLSAGISAPQSVVTDSQGNVWVANQGSWNGNGYSSTVEKFSASGSLLATLSSGISAPQDLVTDSQGNVWVANQGNNTVEKFSASGALLITLSTGIDTASSLATDNLGNVYVSFNTSNGTANHSFINEFSASGILLNTITNGINNPVSLATDSQGNVWVANNGGFDWYTGNSQNSAIEKFSASGALLYSLDTNDAVHVALATDSQGNVWVAASSKNNDVYHDLIAEISTNGVLEQKMSSGIGMISSLSIDSQGNVWVTDTGHNSIEEFVVNSSTVVNQGTQVTITATANSTTTHPVLSIANAIVIQPVHTADSVIIPDALSFTANAVTAANVTSAGGNATTLAGWVTGALSVKGANETAHSIDWFNFNGNTYLVEQANAQGTAYGAGDTIVQLVGVFNEQQASFSGHTLTLV